MKSYIGLAIVLAAIVVAVHSASYSSAIGYFEGSSLRYWDFGSTSNGNSVLGRAYTINVVLPNTTGNSDDGSTGEIQPLLCSSVSCPAVVRSFFSGCFWLITSLFCPDLSLFRGSTTCHTLSVTYARLYVFKEVSKSRLTVGPSVEPLHFWRSLLPPSPPSMRLHVLRSNALF